MSETSAGCRYAYPGRASGAVRVALCCGVARGPDSGAPDAWIAWESSEGRFLTARVCIFFENLLLRRTSIPVDFPRQFSCRVALPLVDAAAVRTQQGNPCSIRSWTRQIDPNHGTNETYGVLTSQFTQDITTIIQSRQICYSLASSTIYHTNPSDALEHESYFRNRPIGQSQPRPPLRSTALLLLSFARSSKP